MLASVGDHEQSLVLSAQAVELDPGNFEAALLAARSCEAIRDFAAAVEWCEQVTNSASNQCWFRNAKLLQAQLQFQHLARWSSAESAYRSVLKIDPENVDALHGLAQLLVTCARRREAIPLILQLIRAGEVTDLVVVLSQESAVMSSPEPLKQTLGAALDDPNLLIGAAWHHAEANEPGLAIESLERAVRLDPDNLAARVALGPLLLGSKDRQRILAWVSELPEDAFRLPEPWIVRAQLAEQSAATEQAARCYWEAARIAPELRQPNSRLAQLLTQVSRQDIAGRFAGAAREQLRLHELQLRVMNAGDFQSPEHALQLVNAYEQQGRLFEACAWGRLALVTFPRSAELRTTEARLNNEIQLLPLSQTVPSANIAAAVDLSGYPLPDAVPGVKARSPVRPASSVLPAVAADRQSPVTFREEASLRGLRFRYFNGNAATPTGKIFELTGGGVGIVDFDGDSFPDVFLTQGRNWPFTGQDNEHQDRLFQNVSGESMRDVTSHACLDDDQFGQGVAVGDVNSDGFPDVYVANIGRNRLWQNNGDGTFVVSESFALAGEERWTTSCVIADLDGDALPDLLDVNYLEGNDVLVRVCPDRFGNLRSCLPVEFDASADRVLWNSGSSEPVIGSETALAGVSSGKGLGAVVWYSEGTPHPRIFVANDTTPNQLLVPVVAAPGTRSFADHGFRAGVAVNENGKAEGCMGIAVADLNSDGLQDCLVTNFLGESNTLYWQADADFFEDRTRATRLDQPSLGVLGFGAQFLDADLDGLPELFVANGHVDDLRDAGKPYRMPPQLFRWNAAAFDSCTDQSLGDYFTANWLGRAASRVDWNRDGRYDLIVGHLDDDYALLTNTSPNPGNFISLKLIGVESNRDAIGTTIRVRDRQRLQVHQLMAGDGYQCSNERRLIVGTGPSEIAESVEILWPSGRQQEFRDVMASRNYLLVEGGSLLVAP